MSVKIFVPRDSTAMALGANEVANTITPRPKRGSPYNLRGS
jgi:hypothetical protein